MNYPGVLKRGHRKPNGTKMIVTKSIGHALDLNATQLLKSLIMPIANRTSHSALIILYE